MFRFPHAVITAGLPLMFFAGSAPAEESPLIKAREFSSARANADETAALGAKAEAEEKLATVVSDMTFENVTLQDAFDRLRAETKNDVFINWRALEAEGVAKTSRVTLRFSNRPLSEAIELLIEVAGGARNGFGCEVNDGIITVSSRMDLAKNTLTRVYDVRALIATDWRNGKPAKPDPRRTDILTGLLMSLVEPESWRNNGGNVGAIRELQGQFIITQTPDSQKTIAVLLNQMTRLAETNRETAPAENPAKPGDAKG